MGLSLPLIMIVNMRYGFYMTQKHQYLQDNVVHLKDTRATVTRRVKLKSGTIRTQWLMSVNNPGSFGRWDFAELSDVYALESDLTEKKCGIRRLWTTK